MRKTLVVSLVTAMMIIAGSAQAQAVRTWVSGVGDDLNPCSRTAPCKTFAGAISKTQAGGEISVLDNGGFGAVTITKAITIDGSAQHGSILHSGTNGVIINVSTLTGGNNVILRDLSINGSGGTGANGLNGVRIIGSSAVNVQIEDCDFQRAQRAVDISPTVAGFKVMLKNCDIRNMSDDAIESQPSAGATVKLTMDHVRVRNSSLAGFHSVRDTNATISNSNFSANVDGIRIDNNTSHLNIVETVFSENSGVGLVNGGTAVTIVDGISVFGNTTGILNNTGGQVLGFANDAVANNNADVTGTGISSLPHP
jgi:hypothetical protein